MFATKAFATRLKNEIIEALDPKFKRIDNQFDEVNTKLIKIDSRLIKVEDKVEKIAEHVGRHCTELQEVRIDVRQIKQHINLPTH